jgi:hypothetical protein
LPSPSWYRLSSGSLVRLKDVVDVYREATHHTVSVCWGGRPYRVREVMEPRSPVPVLPGWQPLISLKDGLVALQPESQEGGDGNG